MKILYFPKNLSNNFILWYLFLCFHVAVDKFRLLDYVILLRAFPLPTMVVNIFKQNQWYSVTL